MTLCGISLFAAPEIRHFAPHAVVPGKSTLLTFSGRDLETSSKLWTSFSGESRRVPNTNGGLVSFVVNCPPDATGIHALQLLGPEGASNFQLVMVDPLATQPHHDNHQRREKAHQIVPPAAVDSILKPEEIDYYGFSANAGQRLSIEAIAHRIGSQADPVVRILDTNGREIAFSDDDGGVWKDARFEFRAPNDAEYILAVHDMAYGGGNAFDYRLRVTSDPLVWFTFPLADPREGGVAVGQVGAGLDRGNSTSPANPAPARLLGAVPHLLEAEPNNDTKSAQSAGAPMILHGRIQTPEDRDYFRLELPADEKVIFQSQTRSLGSPCDLVLTLKKTDGTVIVQSNLAAPGDAALTNKPSSDGPVYLEVRELSGNALPNAPYRIKVQKFTPGFTLSTENNIINVKPGESAKLKITAVRYDFNETIRIAFAEPIEGVTLEASEIPEKKNETELKLTASADLKPGDFHHITLIGTNSAGFTAPVSTRPAVRNQFSLMLNPPPVLEDLFVIAVLRPE